MILAKNKEITVYASGAFSIQEQPYASVQSGKKSGGISSAACSGFYQIRRAKSKARALFRKFHGDAV
jgi:hypothetical protein